jgi:mono/diheme cytochrome c family protein
LTEVPEHLLQRSRERRAALGLGGGDAGGDAAPAAASAAAPATTSATPATPARAAAPAVPAAPKPPPFVPPYVRAAERRQRIPVWALPVVAFLPIWGVLYAQSLSAAPSKELTELAAGATVYSGKCSSCHGPSGGGGAGRPLADGEVLKTFPNIASQLEYVHNGDEGMGGVPYGNPQRPGGQHGPPYNGATMPTFETLTEKELLEVVRHERETLSGEKEGFEVDAAGHRLWPNGQPMLDSSGNLVDPDGEPLFDEDGKLAKPVDPSKPPS